ncbi:hypothetical protein [Streptomyces sp. KLOTTS4A1]|uniref:hypothetical protein n=1 Tax=Streptomyces sp. KLOTTS4A1 TaxID=3390996 RepID=UPI0039F4A29A
MDQELVTALVAAGSALAGGGLTGWFTLGAARRQADAAWAAGQRQADAAWAAGSRQADAAWAAGQQQADAQLAVARQAMREQARAVERDMRRSAYSAFLGKAETAHQAKLAYQAVVGTPSAATRMQELAAAMNTLNGALNLVRLEGPDPVVAAAETLTGHLTPTAAPTSYETDRGAFVAVARAAVSAP